MDEWKKVNGCVGVMMCGKGERMIEEKEKNENEKKEMIYSVLFC